MGDPIVRIARRSQKSIFSKLMSAKWRFGGKSIALTDADGRELTYNEILRASFALGKVIAKHTERGEKVGVLLPTGAGAVIAFFSVLATSRIPAMLNFTAGPRNLESACKAAQVRVSAAAIMSTTLKKIERSY